MDIDWDETNLELWLLKDNWISQDALQLLAGYDPDLEFITEEPLDIDSKYAEIQLYDLWEITGILEWPYIQKNFTLSKNQESDWDNMNWSEIQQQFYDTLSNSRKNFKLYSEVWQSSDFHSEEHLNRTWSGTGPTPRSPRIYIDYFVAKNKPPRWLDWAIENDLYKLTDSNIENTKNLPEDEHSHEMQIAMDAHKNFSLIEGKTYKSSIKEYLKKKYQSKVENKENYLSTDAIERISTMLNKERKGGAPKTP